MILKGSFCPSPHRQAGLTLIELLVSVVILGFVITIMSGAFFQVVKIVRLAENVNKGFQPQWLRSHALTDLVANLIMPENVDRPFKGDSGEFTGFSLLLPQGEWGLAREFTAKLVPSPQGGGVDLTVIPKEGKPMVLASWDRQVRFEYLDVEGASQSMWPPFSKTQDAIPSAIAIRARDGEQLLQLIAPYAGSRQPEPDMQGSLEKLLGVGAK